MKKSGIMLLALLLIQQATAQPDLSRKPAIKKPAAKEKTLPGAVEKTEEEYKKLYDKIKPLVELANLVNKTSGQTISDISYYYTTIAAVPVNEAPGYPAEIETLKATNKRGRNLEFQFNEYTKEFSSTNPVIKQMMVTLKQEYSNYGKPDYTAERLDAFREGIKQAIGLFSLLNSSFPQNTEYKNYLAQTENMRNIVEKKLAEKFAANYTSPFHAAHAQQILLSSKPFVPGKETAAQVKQSFTAGEPISGILYLNNQIKTYNQDYEYIALEVFFDEAISNELINHNGCLGTYYKTIQLSEKETADTYISFDLIPEGLKGNHIPAVYIKKITECMSNLLPGKHRVRVQIGLLPGGMTTAWNRSNTFTTEFELDVTEDGLKALADKVSRLEAAELAAVRMGKPGMQDAAMLQLVKKAAAGNGHTVQKMVIVSDGWSTGWGEDALGRRIPKYKRLYCEYAFKDTDGNCYIQSVDIFREYTGNGTYGTPYTEAGKDFRRRILCENVNK